MSDDILAQAEDLVDHEAVAEAEAALAEHQQRLADARRIAAAADDAVLVARADLAGLVEIALRGEEVGSDRVAASHDEARKAECYSAFSATVARRREEPVANARAVLADVRAVAWQPVLDRAIDLRIAVGVRCDRARLLGQYGRDTTPSEAAARQAAMHKAIEAVRPDFDRANDWLTLAIANGARSAERFTGDRPQFPIFEWVERKYWNRPLLPEDLTNAA